MAAKKNTPNFSKSADKGGYAKAEIKRSGNTPIIPSTTVNKATANSKTPGKGGGSTGANYDSRTTPKGKK